jgi:hypothetical protein
MNAHPNGTMSTSIPITSFSFTVPYIQSAIIDEFGDHPLSQSVTGKEDINLDADHPFEEGPQADHSHITSGGIPKASSSLIEVEVEMSRLKT